MTDLVASIVPLPFSLVSVTIRYEDPVRFIALGIVEPVYVIVLPFKSMVIDLSLIVILSDPRSMLSIIFSLSPSFAASTALAREAYPVVILSVVISTTFFAGAG